MVNDQTALLIKQALGSSGLASNPLIAQLLAQSQATPPVAAVEQPTAANLAEHEVLFINMLRAFIVTEEGNPLVGILTKFARFAQSEVDKAKVKQP